MNFGEELRSTLWRTARFWSIIILVGYLCEADAFWLMVVALVGFYSMQMDISIHQRYFNKPPEQKPDEAKVVVKELKSKSTIWTTGNPRRIKGPK